MPFGAAFGTTQEFADATVALAGNVAGLYGAATVSPRILLVQSVPTGVGLALALPAN